MSSCSIIFRVLQLAHILGKFQIFLLENKYENLYIVILLRVDYLYAKFRSCRPMHLNFCSYYHHIKSGSFFFLYKNIHRFKDFATVS